MQRIKSSLIYAERVLEATCNKVGLLAGVLILAIMVITTYEVVMRYYFKSPSIWPFEYSWIMLIALIYLGTSYTEFQRGHVRVDIVYTSLSKKKGLILDIACSVVAFTYCVFLTWSSFKQAQFMYESHYATGTLLETPLTPLGIINATALILLSLAVVAHIKKDISDLFSGTSV